MEETEATGGEEGNTQIAEATNNISLVMLRERKEGWYLLLEDDLN